MRPTVRSIDFGDVETKLIQTVDIKQLQELLDFFSKKLSNSEPRFNYQFSRDKTELALSLGDSTRKQCAIQNPQTTVALNNFIGENRYLISSTCLYLCCCGPNIERLNGEVQRLFDSLPFSTQEEKVDNGLNQAADISSNKRNANADDSDTSSSYRIRDTDFQQRLSGDEKTKENPLPEDLNIDIDSEGDFINRTDDEASVKKILGSKKLSSPNLWSRFSEFGVGGQQPPSDVESLAPISRDTGIHSPRTGGRSARAPSQTDSDGGENSNPLGFGKR